MKIALCLVILLILSGCGVLDFNLQRAEPTEIHNPLFGTDWALVEMNQQAVLNEPPIYLHFQNKQLNGETGCNFYKADYEIQGDQIKLSLMSITVQLCPSQAIMDREKAYVDLWNTTALKQTASFRLSAGPSASQLILYNQAGQPVLLFEPAVVTPSGVTPTPSPFDQ